MRIAALIAMLALAAPICAAPAPPPVSAKVAMLVDLASGQTLYARNAERPFPPASMTKAMTALVAFEEIERGRLREGQRFTVTPAQAATWSGKGTSMYLQAGEVVTAADLLAGITAASANDAAVVLAEGHAGSVTGWARLMNAAAARHNMPGSRFATPNGWPDGGQTVVSARDLVELARGLIIGHPAKYHRYFGKSGLVWRQRQLFNHDPFVGSFPGGDGIKTGYTREAGYNFLGSAARGGRRLVVVIGGAPSEAARAADARGLAEWGFAGWRLQRLASLNAFVGRAAVQGGAERYVPLAASRGAAVAVPVGSNPRVTVTLVYAGPLRAPIAKGATVARLEIAVDGRPSHVVPLVAARGIAAAGPFDRLRNGLLGLLP